MARRHTRKSQSMMVHLVLFAIALILACGMLLPASATANEQPPQPQLQPQPQPSALEIRIGFLEQANANSASSAQHPRKLELLSDDGITMEFKLKSSEYSSQNLPSSASSSSTLAAEEDKKNGEDNKTPASMNDFETALLSSYGINSTQLLSRHTHQQQQQSADSDTSSHLKNFAHEYLLSPSRLESSYPSLQSLQCWDLSNALHVWFSQHTHRDENWENCAEDQSTSCNEELGLDAFLDLVENLPHFAVKFARFRFSNSSHFSPVPTAGLQFQVTDVSSPSIIAADENGEVEMKVVEILLNGKSIYARSNPFPSSISPISPNLDPGAHLPRKRNPNDHLSYPHSHSTGRRDEDEENNDDADTEASTGGGVFNLENNVKAEIDQELQLLAILELLFPSTAGDNGGHKTSFYFDALRRLFSKSAFDHKTERANADNRFYDLTSKLIMLSNRHYHQNASSMSSASRDAFSSLLEFYRINLFPSSPANQTPSIVWFNDIEENARYSSLDATLTHLSVINQVTNPYFVNRRFTGRSRKENERSEQINWVRANTFNFIFLVPIYRSDFGDDDLESYYEKVFSVVLHDLLIRKFVEEFHVPIRVGFIPVFEPLAQDVDHNHDTKIDAERIVDIGFMADMTNSPHGETSTKDGDGEDGLLSDNEIEFLSRYIEHLLPKSKSDDAGLSPNILGLDKDFSSNTAFLDSFRRKSRQHFGGAKTPKKLDAETLRLMKAVRTQFLAYTSHIIVGEHNLGFSQLFKSHPRHPAKEKRQSFLQSQPQLPVLFNGQLLHVDISEFGLFIHPQFDRTIKQLLMSQSARSFSMQQRYALMQRNQWILQQFGDWLSRHIKTEITENIVGRFGSISSEGDDVSPEAGKSLQILSQAWEKQKKAQAAHDTILRELVSNPQIKLLNSNSVKNIFKIGKIPLARLHAPFYYRKTSGLNWKVMKELIAKFDTLVQFEGDSEAEYDHFLIYCHPDSKQHAPPQTPDTFGRIRIGRFLSASNHLVRDYFCGSDQANPKQKSSPLFILDGLVFELSQTASNYLNLLREQVELLLPLFSFMQSETNALSADSNIPEAFKKNLKEKLMLVLYFDISQSGFRALSTASPQMGRDLEFDILVHDPLTLLLDHRPLGDQILRIFQQFSQNLHSSDQPDFVKPIRRINFKFNSQHYSAMMRYLRLHSNAVPQQTAPASSSVDFLEKYYHSRLCNSQTWISNANNPGAAGTGLMRQNMRKFYRFLYKLPTTTAPTTQDGNYYRVENLHLIPLHSRIFQVSLLTRGVSGSARTDEVHIPDEVQLKSIQLHTRGQIHEQQKEKRIEIDADNFGNFNSIISDRLAGHEIRMEYARDRFVLQGTMQRIVPSAFDDPILNPQQNNQEQQRGVRGIQIGIRRLIPKAVKDSDEIDLEKGPVVASTTVMEAFNGYFQFTIKAPHNFSWFWGTYEVELVGRSAHVFELVDYRFTSGYDKKKARFGADSQRVIVDIDDWHSLGFLQLYVQAKPLSSLDLSRPVSSYLDYLYPDDQDALKKKDESSSMWETLVSIGKKLIPNSQADTEDSDQVNIFSIASGHLYERLLKIMIWSARQNLKPSTRQLRVWFLEDFLSPQFKEFLPRYADHLGFNYTLLSYKWPPSELLFSQVEKYRKIWAFKILFLDALFPPELKRIIFVDADQVIRGNIGELYDRPLSPMAPIAMVPFCDSKVEMEGFRFWKSGYWKQHLGQLNYHISALFLVDLVKFRKMAAGDQYRHLYHSLAQDPNSLSNLDQDLPNFASVSHVKLDSLPSEWLWCDSWCSQSDKQHAKIIDLCNNPMTKEHKIENARRVIPEWDQIDQQIQKFEASLNKT